MHTLVIAVLEGVRPGKELEEFVEDNCVRARGGHLEYSINRKKIGEHVTQSRIYAHLPSKYRNMRIEQLWWNDEEATVVFQKRERNYELCDYWTIGGRWRNVTLTTNNGQQYQAALKDVQGINWGRMKTQKDQTWRVGVVTTRGYSEMTTTEAEKLIKNNKTMGAVAILDMHI